MNYPDGMPANAIENFYGEDPSAEMEKMEDAQERAVKLLNEAWSIEDATVRWLSLSYATSGAIQAMDKLVSLSQRQLAECDHEIAVMKDMHEDNDKEGFMAAVHELFTVYHMALEEYEG